MTADNRTQRIAIIGGGAAGFFLAINLKEMSPMIEVCIFEKSRKILSKVEISGGGRCNCTNSFEN
ncbi:MAG: NAD(P)/FAD-dependent oxidoreductase, partial [Bacteroidaceae bacterium]|nr:NAD(P)/FAD-dependent oxidoreductase [Bacteroidaceae bacterium]